MEEKPPGAVCSSVDTLLAPHVGSPGFDFFSLSEVSTFGSQATTSFSLTGPEH